MPLSDEEDEDDDEEEESEDADYVPNTFFGRRRTMASETAPNGRLRGWHWFTLERTGNEIGRRVSRSGVFGKAGWPGTGQRVRIAPSHEEALSPTPLSPTLAKKASSPRACLGTSPSAPRAAPRRRASSVSSVKSLLTGSEERVRGIKHRVLGRGPWANGMTGFQRDYRRGVWGRSGFEEWNRVSHE